jgi:hypothetical protein
VFGLVLPANVTDIFKDNLLKALKAANIETVAVRGKMSSDLTKSINDVTQNPPASINEWLRPGTSVIPTAVLDGNFQISEIARIFGISVNLTGIEDDPLAVEEANLFAVTAAILFAQAMAGKEITKERLSETEFATLKQNVVDQLQKFQQAIDLAGGGFRILGRELRDAVRAEMKVRTAA